MTNKLLKGALGIAAVSAVALAGGIAHAKDTITIAVPSFLTGGAAGPFGIPAMNGAKMVTDAINKGTLPAPYNTKGFGGATASRLLSLTKVVARRNRLQNIVTLSKSEMLMQSLAIFPLEIARHLLLVAEELKAIHNFCNMWNATNL